MNTPSEVTISPAAPKLDSNNVPSGIHFDSLGGDSNLYDVPVEDAEPCNLYDVPIKDAESNGESPPIDIPNKIRHTDDTKRSKEEHGRFIEPLNAISDVQALMNPCSDPVPTEDDNNSMNTVGPGMIFLSSRPSKEEWDNITAATRNGFAVTGSAAMGHVGPIIGLVDIGECEDSYLFRVALPGVKRDESDFSCEVEDTGKVMIRGVTTTGEKSVYKYSQVFEMQTQNLCPPGDFSVSFQLPGPVDPKQFTGNFGVDAILEGIVMKKKTN